MDGRNSFSTYLRSIRDDVARGMSTEHTHRPALKGLIEDVGDDVVATNEPRRVAAGAPDFAVTRDTTYGPRILGHIEAKDVGADLAEVQESEQLSRYRASLPNLVLTDYLEFRWYVDGSLRLAARLGALDATGRVVPVPGGHAAVEELLAAFLGHTPPPIRSPRELAQRMARVTHLLRNAVLATLAAAAFRPLQDLRQAFAEVLLPDLTDEEFADLFAQTVAYGLFAARVNHAGPAAFTRGQAGREIPRSNPFLRRLFGAIAGAEFDDAPFVGFVDDVAQLLSEADLGSILADFGRRTRREDPVVHFYETFLAAYDPELRETRGVYYTPEPVVSYIVSSVDEVLRTGFALREGLADTSKVTAEVSRGDRSELIEVPKVLVLDPACGTGTFLYTVVDRIRETFKATGNAGRWRSFVREELLARLYGFELLMPPYAVAHLKLGLALAGMDLPEEDRADWGYALGPDERLGVYLTNSLEEAIRRSDLLMGAYLSEEANAAAAIKRELPILVIIGNPPYSGHSANRGEWIARLVHDYYSVDGAPLGERNPKWLQNDYVKFIRFAQWRIERTGMGVLAFITDHGYLDNPTFRGMRQQLLQSFTDISVLNLHGSLKKRERTPTGERDENVFDIQQGVSISVFVKRLDEPPAETVKYADLWGTREAKYDWLANHSLANTTFTDVRPVSPFYLFVPRDPDLRAEYERGWRLQEAMPFNALGSQTHRDDFAVGFDRAEVRARIEALRRTTPSDEAIRDTYGLPVDWDLRAVRRSLRADVEWEAPLRRVLYRPFDWRFAYLATPICDRPRPGLLAQFSDTNLALGVGRQGLAVGGEWDLAIALDGPVDGNVFRRGGAQIFPLYLLPTPAEVEGGLFQPDERRVNLAPRFWDDIAGRTGLAPLETGRGDLSETFGPEDVIAYIYAVLSAPSYRGRYAGQLSDDFPRVPVTGDASLFADLATLGHRLIRIHTDPSTSAVPLPRFPIPGTNVVERGHPRFDEARPTGDGVEGGGGRSYLSADHPRTGLRGQFWEPVPADVWNFRIGGFHPVQEWLKDRRERALSGDEVDHHSRVIAAVAETLALMRSIDEVIHDRGGWPLVGS